MATATDFWNEVERRIEQAIDARLSGLETSEGTSAPPPAAGGLPIHNNAHHEPPLALASDVAALTFLDLTDTPGNYTGSSTFLLRVNAAETAIEFVDGATLFDPAGTAAAAMAAHLLAVDPHTQYYNETRGDARYALIGHLQAVTAGGTGLTGIAADNLIYSSALDTFSPTPISAFGRSLIDDADATAARATLVAAGTGVTNTFSQAQTITDLRSTNVKLFATGAADLTIQRLSANSETTLRIMPKGTAASNPSALEFFGTDFVADGTNFERLILTAKGSADAAYWLRTNAGGTGVVQPLRIGTGTNNGIWFDTNGEIGINTLTPAAPLHVAGTTLVARLEATNAAGNVWLSFDYNNSGNNYGVIWQQAGALVIRGGDFGGKIQLSPYNGGTHNAALGLTVGTSGEVLIGRSTGLSGAGDLDVNGNFRVSGNAGFYGTTPVARPTITGSRGGVVALTNFLAGLASQGLIIDSTTP